MEANPNLKLIGDWFCDIVYLTSYQHQWGVTFQELAFPPRLLVYQIHQTLFQWTNMTRGYMDWSFQMNSSNPLFLSGMANQSFT